MQSAARLELLQDALAIQLHTRANAAVLSLLMVEGQTFHAPIFAVASQTYLGGKGKATTGCITKRYLTILTQAGRTQ